MSESKIALVDWFHSTEELLKIGFTKKEIEDAIIYTKTKLSDVTTDWNYVEKGKENYILAHPELYEIINENTRYTFKEVEFRKGKEWVHEYEASAIQYRSRTPYNIHDPKILTEILHKKFPFMHNFNWEIFSINFEGSSWEIYMKTEKGTLYVPVKALFKKNPNLIRQRMNEYWNSYRNKRDPNVKTHNHTDEEHQSVNGGCPYCQQQFFESEIAPLESKEALKLFEEMI